MQWYLVLLLALSTLISQTDAVSIRTLCIYSNQLQSPQLRDFCSAVFDVGFEESSPERDLDVEEGDAENVVPDGYFNIRTRRSDHLASRRDGQYIRFGRSADSPKSNPSLMSSFGAERQTRAAGDNNYVRFGRSVNENEASAPKQDAQSAAKRFMRFGRGGEGSHVDDAAMEAVKRFMRFGKRDQIEEDKRFMRFGRQPEHADEDVEKRFMRFGKSASHAFPEEKRFMRFGRAHLDDDMMEAEKRFMRFGKREDATQTADKRFMRFGKRGLKFGRSGPPKEGDGFMRFGRTPFANEMEKRFMRFGKKSTIDADGKEKRFMRFGKREDDAEHEEEKRFMRFGRDTKENKLTVTVAES